MHEGTEDGSAAAHSAQLAAAATRKGLVCRAKIFALVLSSFSLGEGTAEQAAALYPDGPQNASDAPSAWR